MARVDEVKATGNRRARHSDRIARFNAELEVVLEAMRSARKPREQLGLSDAEAARLARLALSRWHYRHRLDALTFEARTVRLAEFLAGSQAGKRVRQVPSPWIELARALAERLRQLPEA